MHPLLAPVVERNEKGGPRAWRVRAAGLDPNDCYDFAPTKRDASKWLEPEQARRWGRGAAGCAERVGKIAAASLPASAIACGRYEVEPHDRTLDQGDHCPRGGSPTCGDPVQWRLGGIRELAQHRLGWTPKRWTAALLDRWSIDHDKIGPAWGEAEVALLAGDLRPGEAEVLRATPETIGYLRLRADRCAALGHRLYALEPGEARRWWASEEAQHTCYAPSA